MGRALTPTDLMAIGRVYFYISNSPWFEPGDANALARYLVHHYSMGHDEESLQAVAERFAREWFRVGLGRFDALKSGFRSSSRFPTSCDTDLDELG